MERKPMSNKEKEKLASEATSDEEQAKWEKKELGAEGKYVEKSKFYKAPGKLVSLRVPEEVLSSLQGLADLEGLKCQSYILSLLKKHVKKKAG